MRPSRDYSPGGLARKVAKRWAWRARRISNRLTGFRTTRLRTTRLRTTRLRNLFGDCVHEAPVYRDLARRAWRA